MSCGCEHPKERIWVLTKRIPNIDLRRWQERGKISSNSAHLLQRRLSYFPEACPVLPGASSSSWCNTLFSAFAHEETAASSQRGTRPLAEKPRAATPSTSTANSTKRDANNPPGGAFPQNSAKISQDVRFLRPTLEIDVQASLTGTSPLAEPSSRSAAEKTEHCREKAA